jgi:hypothetical protein
VDLLDKSGSSACNLSSTGRSDHAIFIYVYIYVRYRIIMRKTTRGLNFIDRSSTRRVRRRELNCVCSLSQCVVRSNKQQKKETYANSLLVNLDYPRNFFASLLHGDHSLDKLLLGLDDDVAIADLGVQDAVCVGPQGTERRVGRFAAFCVRSPGHVYDQAAIRLLGVGRQGAVPKVVARAGLVHRAAELKSRRDAWTLHDLLAFQIRHDVARQDWVCRIHG